MSTQSRVTSITGVTRKETSKGELFVIATGDGAEFTTFQGALANQAYSLRDQQVELFYVEKSVTRADGRSFTNRYYERATPVAATAAAPTFGVAPARAPLIPTGDGGRELKIMRQTATKVGAHLLAYLPLEERTPSGLLTMADFLVDYYEHGQPRADAASFANDPGPAAPATHTDDDIPF